MIINIYFIESLLIGLIQTVFIPALRRWFMSSVAEKAVHPIISVYIL